MRNDVTMCTEEPLKNYVLNFRSKEGNGWAFINARTINQAIKVFKTQTKYSDIKIRDIKELKYWGEEIQLVFEGTASQD